MSNILTTARTLAEKTPAERNRVVDLMRVISILVVIFGHWLMAAVAIFDGEVVAGNALSDLPMARPLTWLLQVMPIFFFVGGYSNALSWRSARRRGETYGGWLRARLRRLTLPVVPLLVVWGSLGWLALQAGFDSDLLRMASAAALGPTWFLAVYVVIVCLAPAALVAWERWGWRSVLTGLLLAGATDLISISLDIVPLGFVNYIFVWATVHQLGYAWLDGATDGTRRRVFMVAVGLVATLVLVLAGPYPVAMVGFDTGALNNSFPPKVTLALLGVFQAGLVLVFEPYLARLMQATRRWAMVVLVSGQMMTLYLWHLTSLVILLATGLALDGFGFGIEPFSGLWWLTRPVWIAVLIVVTLLLAAVFGRFERPQSDPRQAPSAWRPVLAAVMICAGLGSMAAIGIADTEGINGLILVLPLAGIALGGVSGVTLRNRIGRI